MKKLALLSTFLGLLALVFLPAVLKNHGIYLFTYWLIYVIAAMGLNLTVGYAGQKSLGHAAFFGIGAYTVAIMLKAGLSFWLGLPMAALGCFIVGLALGFPALRVQTIYLAFATLGFNTALWLVMRNEEWLTGGTFGINNIARPEAFGISLDGNLAYYYLVLGVTLLLAALLLGLLRSPWGKAFTALRDNPIRAESLGIDIRNYTLLSFAIGAAYAGIAGALFASLVQFIDPAPFNVEASIMMYLMVVVGGPGYFLGPLLGAAVGVILPEWLRFAQAWYLLIFGLSVMLLMVWLPDGLLSWPDRWRARWIVGRRDLPWSRHVGRARRPDHDPWCVREVRRRDLGRERGDGRAARPGIDRERTDDRDRRRPVLLALGPRAALVYPHALGPRRVHHLYDRRAGRVEPLALRPSRGRERADRRPPHGILRLQVRALLHGRIHQNGCHFHDRRHPLFGRLPGPLGGCLPDPGSCLALRQSGRFALWPHLDPRHLAAHPL